jgi:hypothetical protein
MSSLRISHRFDPLGVLFFCGATVVYIAYALIASVALSPRVPYADAWHHYDRLLSQPFRTGVFAFDNGHPEIFANLIRYLDLHYLAGNENWQIAIGLMLALAAYATLAVPIATDRTGTRLAKCAALFTLSLGVFWFANERALAHDNDALHVYFVLLCLFTAVRTMLAWGNPERSGARIAVAACLCAVASFNFGSGIACFAAIIVLAFVQRATWRELAFLIAAGAATVLVYFLCLGPGVNRGAATPLDRIAYAISSLAAPIKYLFWPSIDPAAAQRMPAAARSMFLASANGWTDVFGPFDRTIFPQILFGCFYLAVLLWNTLIGRLRGCDRLTRIGLALGWFGAAVAMAIGLFRADAFLANAGGQVYAPRYLPWSTLGWCGLLLIWLGRGADRALPFAVAGAIALLATPAELGMTMIAAHQRNVAEDGAVAMMAGVDPDTDLGENVLTEMRSGARRMKESATGVFALPESDVLGRHVDAARFSPVSPRPRIGYSASGRIALEFDDAAKAPACKYLVISTNGVATGVVRRIDATTWTGYSRSTTMPDAAPFAANRCTR